MKAVLAIFVVVMALPVLLVAGIALGPAILALLLVVALALPVLLLEGALVGGARARHRH